MPAVEEPPASAATKPSEEANPQTSTRAKQANRNTRTDCTLPAPRAVNSILYDQKAATKPATRGNGPASYRVPKLAKPGILAAEACRAFMPAREKALRLLQECAERVGREETCALLSVPEWKVRKWLAGSPCAIWPQERKVIWLVHCLIFDPSRLRSLFDVATFGRYLPKGKC